jgi:hypothetical protein
MSILKPAKPRQERTTGSAASHRTAGRKRKETDNYFLDAIFGNKGARKDRWERRIK